MNHLFSALLLLPLVGASHAAPIVNDPALESPSRKAATTFIRFVASTPALGSPADVEEDVELNREADDRLRDGQAPVPVRLADLAFKPIFSWGVV